MGKQTRHKSFPLERHTKESHYLPLYKPLSRNITFTLRKCPKLIDQIGQIMSHSSPSLLSICHIGQEERQPESNSSEWLFCYYVLLKGTLVSAKRSTNFHATI